MHTQTEIHFDHEINDRCHIEVMDVEVMDTFEKRISLNLTALAYR